MGQFAVTYDLNNANNRERKKFESILEEEFFGEKMETTTTYLVEYNHTAEELSDDIKELCDENNFSFKLILTILGDNGSLTTEWP